jgi:hypothetical protein
VDIDLYENGSKVKDLVAGTVTNTSLGDTALAYFDASEITDGDNVEVLITGSRTYQAAVQVDSITWQASVDLQPAVSVWTGTDWKSLRVWDGATWNETVRVWTGTEWVPPEGPQSGTAVAYGVAAYSGNTGSIANISNAFGSDTATYAQQNTAGARMYVNIDTAPFQAIPAGATITGMRAYGYTSGPGGDLDYALNGTYKMYVTNPSDGWYEFVVAAGDRPTLAQLQAGGDAGVNIGLTYNASGWRLHAVRVEVDWEGT